VSISHVELHSLTEDVESCDTATTLEVSRVPDEDSLCISLVGAAELISALTLLVGWQEVHLALKKYGRVVEVSTGYSGWSGTQPDGQCVCLC